MNLSRYTHSLNLFCGCSPLMSYFLILTIASSAIPTLSAICLTLALLFLINGAIGYICEHYGFNYGEIFEKKLKNKVFSCDIFFLRPIYACCLKMRYSQKFLQISIWLLPYCMTLKVFHWERLWRLLWAFQVSRWIKTWKSVGGYSDHHCSNSRWKKRNYFLRRKTCCQD